MELTFRTHCAEDLLGLMDGLPSSSAIRMTLVSEGDGWEFPRDAFVEYEARDEAWAKPLGFGVAGRGRCETQADMVITDAAVEYGDLLTMTVSGRAVVRDGVSGGRG